MQFFRKEYMYKNFDFFDKKHFFCREIIAWYVNKCYICAVNTQFFFKNVSLWSIKTMRKQQ